MKYLSAHWDWKFNRPLSDDEVCRMEAGKGGTEDMAKKEALEMLDDMEKWACDNSGSGDGFITQEGVLSLTDEKRTMVEALEQT